MKLHPPSSLAMVIRTFLPSFSRNTVSEQIDMLRAEIKERVLPLYESCIDETTGFRGDKAFSDPSNISDNAIVMKSNINFDNREFTFKPKNMVEAIYQIFSKMDAKLEYLDELITKSFGNEIVNTQLSYLQANLLRLVELSEFYVLYARRFLIKVVHHEYAHLNRTGQEDSPLVKADLVFLSDNLRNFTAMSRIWSVDKENFIRAIKGIPDITISDDAETEAQHNQVYGSKLDPLQAGFLPYFLNPIYHVRNAILHWRNYRINAARAEVEYLELNIQRLQLKRNGTDNAHLDKVIAANVERMKKANTKLARLQEDYDKTYGLA